MKFDSVFKYFPPSRFLNPLRVGISFSDFAIKAIKFGGVGNKFPIRSLRIPLEPGTVVGGVVVKPEQLTEKLKEVKDKFGFAYVSFTMPDEQTYIFGADVPVVAGKDATESVGFVIEENAPLSLEDTAFDFVPIGLQEEGGNHSARMIVAACVKSEVEKSIEAIRQAGLEPLSSLPESQAIALSVVPKGLDETTCVVHARKNRIGIYLVKAGVVHFATLRSEISNDYEQEFKDEYGKFLEYWSKYHKGADRSSSSLLVCGEFE